MASNRTDWTEHPITETPVIKQNAYPYNYVTNKQAQTLASETFSKMGIYDLAGNVYEWTLEKTSYSSYLYVNVNSFLVLSQFI